MKSTSSFPSANTESTMDGSYWTSSANSLELTELFSVNKRIFVLFSSSARSVLSSNIIAISVSRPLQKELKDKVVLNFPLSEVRSHFLFHFSLNHLCCLGITIGYTLMSKQFFSFLLDWL